MQVSKASAKMQFMARLEQRMQRHAGRNVLYFCMEYGLKRSLPIYSGGLGVLAGDTLKSAANMGDPLAGVGLLYRDGYFKQRIEGGEQRSLSDKFDPSKHPDLVDLEESVKVNIAGREVTFRVWGHEVSGGSEDRYVPLLLLDSLGYPNAPGFVNITRYLYPAHDERRLQQEMALGIGGMRLFKNWKLPFSYYHLNEGHAAFAPVEYLRSLGKGFEDLSPEDYAEVRGRSSFTTHTPVPAGFDRFRIDRIYDAFTDPLMQKLIIEHGRDPENVDYINMAHLAMKLCGARNGVSILHAEVSERMFPKFVPIIPITNGVHHLTWVSQAMGKLYDKFCPDWRRDPTQLIKLKELKSDKVFREELWHAHQEAKTALFEYIREKAGQEFDPEVFTIGFARRFATYKRGDLIFTDFDRLVQLAEENGGLQVVFAGKAHPRDSHGQNILAKIIRIAENSKGKLRVAFLQNYNMDVGALLTAGVDAWLNTPIPPKEASGTSGMKAALNAVPHFSTEDGWWVEGSRGDSTGWTIGKGIDRPTEGDPHLYLAHSNSLYKTLAEILRSYADRQSDSTFIDKMILAAAENGAFFNTHRMVTDYREKVWSPKRILTAGKIHREETEITLPPEAKFFQLAKITSQIARAKKQHEIENLAARGIIGNLRRSFRVTRYAIHDGSVKIHRRWQGTRMGENIIEEVPGDFGETGFIGWKSYQEFQGEVMGDLLHEGKIQIVKDPKTDRRCYRDERLVSEYPFILIPEIVNGKIVGAYKIDFRTDIKLESAYKNERFDKFLDIILKEVDASKKEILSKELDADLATFNSARSLTNWALTLLTAGGFVAMPDYTQEANRTAFFASIEKELVGKLGIGDTSWDGHHHSLAELSRDAFAMGVEKYLRNLDQSASALNKIVEGEDLGKSLFFGPILVQSGIPVYDPKEFSGSFDARRLADLKSRVEKLFEVDGEMAEEYLLLPVTSESGKFLGIVYIDNIFYRKPLSVGRFQNIVSAFGRHLARLPQDS
jgi:starch phosphorylase